MITISSNTMHSQRKSERKKKKHRGFWQTIVTRQKGNFIETSFSQGRRRRKVLFEFFILMHFKQHASKFRGCFFTMPEQQMSLSQQTLLMKKECGQTCQTPPYESSPKGSLCEKSRIPTISHHFLCDRLRPLNYYFVDELVDFLSI